MSQTMIKKFFSPIWKDAGQSGFTIIELLTVIAIILFLSAMVFANYRAGNNELSLELEANNVAADIRKVQEMGLSAPGVPNFADQIIGGYGVYFTSAAGSNESYSFFVDNNPLNGKFDVGPGGDTVLQTITLDANYYIASVNTNAVSILFIPPEPSTKIIGTTGSLAQATIIIASRNDPSLTRSIIVDRAGLIYVH
jgi:prepilin-type N-terminal cleavage/methylation domain-containing protein